MNKEIFLILDERINVTCVFVVIFSLGVYDINHCYLSGGRICCITVFIDAIYLFASFMILLLVYVNSCDVSVIIISFEVI